MEAGASSLPGGSAAGVGHRAAVPGCLSPGEPQARLPAARWLEGPPPGPAGSRHRAGHSGIPSPAGRGAGRGPRSRQSGSASFLGIAGVSPSRAWEEAEGLVSLRGGSVATVGSTAGSAAAAGGSGRLGNRHRNRLRRQSKMSSN
uniref:Uncharacterized protein n=1 Tax=Otus sunia TaxID=257818 RepID=A0A8C8E9W6_9STRI